MIVIAIITLLVALGKALDQYLLNEEKSNLYSKLSSLLKRLDEIEFNNILGKIVEAILTLYAKVFKQKSLVKQIAIILLSSWLLTTIFSQLNYFHPQTKPYLSDLRVWHDLLPHWIIYLTNLLFDFLTITTTIVILKFIKNKGFWFSLFGLLIDSLAALTFYIFCIISFGFLSSASWDMDSLSESSRESTNLSINITDSFSVNMRRIGVDENTITDVLELGYSEKAKINWIGMEPDITLEWQVFYEGFPKYLKGESIWKRAIQRFEIIEGKKTIVKEISVIGTASIQRFTLALTTFLPTAILLITLLIILISKEILKISHFIGKRFVMSAIQTTDLENFEPVKFKPGLHIGVLLGVIIAIIQLVIIMLKTFF